MAPDNDLAPAQPDFPAKTAGLQERLASALAKAYAQGGSSQQGACGPPGDRVWCKAPTRVRVQRRVECLLEPVDVDVVEAGAAITPAPAGTGATAQLS